MSGCVIQVGQHVAVFRTSVNTSQNVGDDAFGLIGEIRRLIDRNVARFSRICIARQSSKSM